MSFEHSEKWITHADLSQQACGVLCGVLEERILAFGFAYSSKSTRCVDEHRFEILTDNYDHRWLE